MLPDDLWSVILYEFGTEEDAARFLSVFPCYLHTWRKPYTPSQLLHCKQYGSHPLQRVATETLESFCRRLVRRRELQNLSVILQHKRRRLAVQAREKQQWKQSLKKYPKDM
jgi:hypothetical protein